MTRGEETAAGKAAQKAPPDAESAAKSFRANRAKMSENTRYFAKIVPSLRASTTDILDRQHTQAQQIDVPVCGGVTCWWHAAKNAPKCGAEGAAAYAVKSAIQDAAESAPENATERTAANTAQSAAQSASKYTTEHKAVTTAKCGAEGTTESTPKSAPENATCATTFCAPVIFELHGGGFVLGDARKDDAFCAALRDNTGAHVVGIAYPKAPEQPYPAAADAVWETLSWFAQNAAHFHMDANRFALVGFSSGGNLAAVTSLRAAQCHNAPFCLAAQVLHYPFLDAATPPTQKNPQPWDLPAEVMDAFTELYCAGAAPQDAMISPVFAAPEQLRGVAPALLLTAERDALQAEGAQYAEKLQAAGVPVEAAAVPHAHHGYVEDWFNPACYEATPEDTRALHEAQFGISAQCALDKTADFLRRHLR